MHIVRWLLCVAASVLLFCSIWIVVPAPNLLLLPLGVGVPELSPLLLATSLIVFALALKARKGVAGRIAAVFSLISVSLYALPLMQVPAVVGRFDEAMPRSGGSARPDRPLSVSGLLRGIDVGDARIARGIQVGASDGSALTVDVYRPPGAGRFPIIVQIYGGAWQRGVPGDNAAFAQYFASRGYVVFAIDYRHAPKWQWPAQIEDVRSALAWIRAHASEYDGDRSRTALVGRSSGAQLALVAAYEAGADAVSAVVSYYGPTDLAEGWRVPPRPDPLNVRAVLEAYLGGTPDQVPGRYREASPISHVTAASPRTLLVYGTRDHIVEAHFGRDLHHRLQAAGASSVLLEIPWAEHAFDVLPSGLAGQLSLAYTEGFLAQALR
jgi:acetyl esterase/lipase